MFQAFKVISEAQSMDKKKSLALLDYYAKVEREIQGLDATFLYLLKTSEGDFLSKIKTRMQDRECKTEIMFFSSQVNILNIIPYPNH